MARRAEKYVGKIYPNKYNTMLQVIKHHGNRKVDVLDIENDFLIGNVDLGHLTKGNTCSPFDKNHYGYGYNGVGKYNKKHTPKCYKTWINILNRCFSEDYKEKYPTYENVSICDEWLCLQSFGVWHDKNYYEIDNERMEIDKDILIKGNEVYSPETCIYVPRRINSLLITNKKIRGRYAIGVDFNSNKYRARCNTLDGSKFIGHYNNEEDAFFAYKDYKENYIKTVADIYKDKIPIKLYEALYKYKVEMSD